MKTNKTTFWQSLSILCIIIISQIAGPTIITAAAEAISSSSNAVAITSARTTNLTFTPVADTYVAQDYPDTNFGTNPQLRVDNSPIMRSYLRFTVSGLNGETVQSVKLRLYANTVSDVGYSVYAVSDNNWDENTMTFNNSPAAGVHINNSQPFPSGAWTEVDISTYIKGEGTYTLLLTTTSDTTIKLASKDSGSNVPQLVVSTVSQAPTNTPTSTSIAPTATKTPAATSIAPTATKAPRGTKGAPPATNTPGATGIAPTATKVPRGTKGAPPATNTPTATGVAPTATNTPAATPTPANTPTSGTVWYVDSSATGSNLGTSWNNAWKSFADVNFSIMGSEATLYISGGTTSKTYTGTINVPAGTTSVTITKGVDAGHNGEVIFDGQNSTQNGIYINAVGTPVKNLHISNLTFSNYIWSGVYGSGKDSGGLQGITVDNCKFLDFNRAGVFFQGNNNINNNYNIVVRNSYFDDNNAGTGQSDGIYVQVLKDFTADHNTIILDNNYTGVENLHSDNIQSFWVDNVMYSNNLLIQDSNKTLGTQMLFTENGHGEHVFLNNILIKNMPYAADSAMRLKSGSGSTFTAKIIGNSYYGMGPILNSSVVSVIKNNILYGISQPDTSIAMYRTSSGSDVSQNIFYDPNNKFPSSSGGMDVNPMFVSIDFNAIDLHLKSNSPAIDAGVNLGSAYILDIEGKSRGEVWNIGVYD